MSLVGTVGSLFNWGVFAAVLIWFGTLKLRGAAPIAELWYAATADMRELSGLLPPMAAASGWFLLFLVMTYSGAGIALLLWVFVVPTLIVWQLLGMGAPIGWLKGAAGVIKQGSGSVGSSGSSGSDGSENFALPMDVNESEADDVGTWFGDSVPVPRRSLLTLGASGSGKSETLKHFVDQLQSDPNEPVVVFDMKDDYREFLADRDVPMLRLSSEGSDVRWNIFEEMETEADADEIARALFPDDGEDNFFSTAGRQLFAANLKYLDREIDNPTNADLVDYWQRADPEKMYENLTRDGHEDLTSAAAAIDPEAGRQSSGVFATAQQQVSDLFKGDFAGDGGFSIRQYMENPQGRVLVLDYPSRQAETIAPIFRFLIDQSIMHGMDDPDRQAFYLLDEIEHMDAPITRIGELINVGRGVNCQAILSLQSVAQLYDTYGEKRGQALLSGMTTSIILRCADSESVEFARETIGTEFHEYTQNVEKSTIPGGNTITTNRETKPEEEHVFAKGAFRSFEPGEAVVCRQGNGYVYGRIKMLQQ